jgi:hypothetical protein
VSFVGCTNFFPPISTTGRDNGDQLAKIARVLGTEGLHAWVRYCRLLLFRVFACWTYAYQRLRTERTERTGRQVRSDAGAGAERTVRPSRGTNPTTNPRLSSSANRLAATVESLRHARLRAALRRGIAVASTSRPVCDRRSYSQFEQDGFTFLSQ